MVFRRITRKERKERSKIKCGREKGKRWREGRMKGKMLDTDFSVFSASR